jgi:hypothetical protein
MKKVIVDGHNLIPKLPGLRLDDLDDESKLLNILLDVCRLTRTQVDLFFDGAPVGFSQKTNYGLVRIHPVRSGLTADEAIISFLRANGKNARNLTVVSSDHRVQIEARALHAAVVRSEEFSSEIRTVLSSTQAVQEMREKTLSPEEIEQWEELFKLKKKNE